MHKNGHPGYDDDSRYPDDDEAGRRCGSSKAFSGVTAVCSKVRGHDGAHTNGSASWVDQLARHAEWHAANAGAWDDLKADGGLPETPRPDYPCRVVYPGGLTDREHAILTAHRWQIAHGPENIPVPTEAYTVIVGLLALLPEDEVRAAIALRNTTGDV